MAKLRLLFLSLVCSMALAAFGNGDVDNILILDSYSNYSWANSLAEAVLTDYVGPRANTMATIESLRVLAEPDEDSMMRLVRDIVKKYSTKRIKMIVVLGNPAFVLFHNTFHKEWKNIPIVWCANNSRVGKLKDYVSSSASDVKEDVPAESLVKGLNAVIVKCPVYIKENVDLMLRLNPGMKRLVLLSDGRHGNELVRDKLKTFMKKNHPEMKLSFFTAGKDDFESVLDSIRSYGKTTGLLLSSWIRENEMLGTKYVEANSYKMLAAASPQPLFTLVDEGVHENETAGGYFSTSEDQGLTLVNTMKEIEANGWKAAGLPARLGGEPKTVLCYPILKKGKIPEVLFPEDAVVVSAPPPFHVKYRWAITVFVVFTIITISLLVIMFREHKLKEKKLQFLRRYKVTLDNMPVVYFKDRIIFDKAGNVVDYVLENSNQLYENSTEGTLFPIGAKGSEYGTTRFKEMLAIFNEVMKKRKPYIYEAYNARDDRYYETFVIPSAEEDSVEVFGMDITKRKIMEADLRKAMEKAEEANRLKSAFLANMSHEIRTPLNAIVGFSNLLAYTDDENEKQEYVRIVENNNNQLLQLIGDILDLSRVESGLMEFVYSDFDVNALMRELESMFVQRVSGTSVRVVCESEIPEPCIHSEKTRLTQVLSNLLTNAVKFTSEGSVTFGCRMREDGMIYFYVEDTGCGIPENKREAVFDRFVKLNRFKPGTGLGLSICSTIVKKMGGDIGVESELGKGSKFWFTVPYSSALKTAKGDVVVESSPADTADMGAEESATEKKRILIAEDNESNYLLFYAILSRNYNIIHATNGQEAVELFKAHKPNLVVMDINMPVMNGYDATRQIRELSAKVPVVAATAYAYEADEARILNSGFNAFVSKPIDAGELKEKISSLLSANFTPPAYSADTDKEV